MNGFQRAVYDELEAKRKYLKQKGMSLKEKDMETWEKYSALKREDDHKKMNKVKGDWESKLTAQNQAFFGWIQDMKENSEKTVKSVLSCTIGKEEAKARSFGG